MQSSAANLAQKFKTLSLYKHLYKNLRDSLKVTSIGNNSKQEEPFIEVLRSEFRQNMVSDSKYCMKKDEMYFMANAFLTYMTSTKQTLELYSKYCRGERSIEESAKIVGLKLPKQYEGPSTTTN